LIKVSTVMATLPVTFSTRASPMPAAKSVTYQALTIG
jgi:hypothetical protein